jgi:hypothetical protein
MGQNQWSRFSNIPSFGTIYNKPQNRSLVEKGKLKPNRGQVGMRPRCFVAEFVSKGGTEAKFLHIWKRS